MTSRENPLYKISLLREKHSFSKTLLIKLKNPVFQNEKLSLSKGKLCFLRENYVYQEKNIIYLDKLSLSGLWCNPLAIHSCVTLFSILPIYIFHDLLHSNPLILPPSCLTDLSLTHYGGATLPNGPVKGVWSDFSEWTFMLCIKYNHSVKLVKSSGYYAQFQVSIKVCYSFLRNLQLVYGSGNGNFLDYITRRNKTRHYFETRHCMKNPSTTVAYIPLLCHFSFDIKISESF